MEREHILKTLEITGWRVSGEKTARRACGAESDHAGGADEEARHQAEAWRFGRLKAGRWVNRFALRIQ